MTETSLSMKQKQNHRHGEQAGGGHSRWGWGMDGVGGEGLQMGTIIYRTDKQQSPIVQHRNHIQYPMINHNEKNIKKNIYIYIYI